MKSSSFFSHFDLEMVLVVGALVTGLVWLLDAFIWKPRRKAAAESASGQGSEALEPWYVEYSRSFFPVLFVVLILRSFIVEPFRIPSGSMIPTLMVGDFILVNKFAYGVRLPVVHTKVADTGEPKRGDVVVFRYPRNPDLDYIKRMIGLPGDRISYHDKRLSINGKLVEKIPLGPYQPQDEYFVPNDEVFLEKLDGVEHKILNNIRNSRGAEGEYVVPDGYYFVMGDNRDNSNDSRFWGFVPEENLVGRAMVIWMHWNFTRNRVGFDRIGTVIH